MTKVESGPQVKIVIVTVKVFTVYSYALFQMTSQLLRGRNKHVRGRERAEGVNICLGEFCGIVIKRDLSCELLACY